MQTKDPHEKLLEAIKLHLEQGKEESEIVNALIDSGIDEMKAKKVIQIVQSTRQNYPLNIFIFCISVILFVLFIGIGFYNVLGEVYFVEQAKWYGLAFVLCLIVFSLLGGMKGKVSLYMRIVNSCIWLLSSGLLMLAMFLHSGWESQWLGTGGGWRGQIVTLIGNAVYWLGPTGVFYISLVSTLLISMFLWVDYNKLKSDDFSRI